MKVRFLHCSNSLENYYICLDKRVAGFSRRGAQSGDLVYLAVKVGKKSLCGARFTLNEPTDYKPWPDSENYTEAYSITNLEYCTPFNISILFQVGGQYWAMKYIQGAKTIYDKAAIELLNSEFLKYKSESLIRLESENPLQIKEESNDLIIEDEKELQKLIKEVPDAKVNIMGTFQTVNFSNETDKIRGLETLVNENFYSLFPQFPETKSLLIPENRLFKTEGFIIEGNNVQGIRSIPDGILIEYDRVFKNPFRINLIEYECYGERKQKETEKSTYLNSIIIPQLMRFASAFSIITDEQTRIKTIANWVDKIITFINSEERLSSKFIGWIKEIHPEIKERSIEREIERQLINSFKNNLRVILVIDELSTEQRSTIKNVVSSFRLATGENNVQFSGFVVRLVQKINIINNESEYALTVQ